MPLIVDKRETLQGDPVEIGAKDLTPFSLYEIKLLMKLDQGTFRAFGVFRSDASGGISLATHEPLRGTYTGIRSMGLFESLEPLADFREGGYTGWEYPSPWNYELILSDTVGVIDSTTLTKNFALSSVERIVVEEGRIRGTIYKPRGSGPFPALIDMTGTGGGLREHRAAAFASEGFCVLALAFFSYKDLPTTMTDVELEYFMEAAQWLSRQPFASSRIGLHGNSFGGAVVLVMTKHCPEIKSVVSINPPHFFTDLTHLHHNGTPMGHTDIDGSNIVWRNGRMLYDKTIQYLEVTDDADFHLEKAPKDVSFRFVVSIDDQCTCPIFSVQYYTERLKKSGHYVETQALPGGHLMELPYFPHHASCYSAFAGTFMAYGGETSQHGNSQELAWKETVNFFKRTLTDGQIKSKI